MNVTLRNKDIDSGLVFIKSFTQREISIKVSFAIGKTLRRLRGVHEVMQEERKKLIKKHQATDSDGKVIETKKGDIKLTSPKAFQEDFEELMKQETEVDVHQIKYEELIKMKDREGNKIQPTSEEMEGLLLLQMIIEEEDEDEEKDDD